MRENKLFFLFLASLFAVLFVAQPVFADIDWNEKKQLKLDAAPIDIVSSADGKFMYVLTAGEIQVYSLPDYTVAKRIPIEKGYDRLAYSAPDNSLIASSTSGKAVKVLQLNVLHRFSLEGLPFKGPEKAPVTLVVFSDYQ